jgi:hypothetical protein
MQSTKEKIKKVVIEYMKLFPAEYDAFLNSVRQKNEAKSNAYAEIKGGDQMVRHLFDIPETLYYCFRTNLTDDEFNWIFGTNDHKKQRAGLSWFIRTFPQFKITKDF